MTLYCLYDLTTEELYGYGYVDYNKEKALNANAEIQIITELPTGIDNHNLSKTLLKVDKNDKKIKLK